MISGYRQLLGWLQSFGDLEMVGVEGTGSYGAGLARCLHDHGVRVVKVDRPNRQRRRRRGKSDPQDATTAARAAQSGDARMCAWHRGRGGGMFAACRLRIDQPRAGPSQPGASGSSARHSSFKAPSWWST